ncbi:pectinesterase inhibitor-like [Zingiber officinale]|uniref:Pectinesterase inhibitor domain-containing protein n=1 Tax=Zingiber officinale TaxID=94328 RepID=A0A8J5H5V4_ZINOF|nr:pectinesterase inhibitor-like [Zingiber officinale]KAG6520944.1 hypothetical protein ZIOFF_018008 [Zingiber officinale]
MRPNQLLPLIILLASSAAAAALRAHIGVIALCALTDYPVVCLDAAKSFGSSYPPSPDAGDLLSMHLDMAAKHTRAAKAEVEEQLKWTENAREQGALKVCASQFGDALDDMGKARNAILVKDAGTANSMLSAVITYYSTCDDAFTEIKRANPVAKQDDALSKIISNALALGQLALAGNK